MQTYMSVPQVAKLLQLSERTVYRLAQAGSLPAFKVGGSWRFRRRDIDRWAERQIREAGGKRTAR